MKQQPEALPPDIYDRTYYLHHRGGSAEFLRSRSAELCDSHTFALSLTQLGESDRVLDVGSGCGEVSLNAALTAGSVLGIDFAPDAVELAMEAKSTYPMEIQGKVDFLVTDVEAFEYESHSYDVVFFLDVIEHLYQHQIDSVLAKLFDTLTPGGRLIVHTWPNVGTGSTPTHFRTTSAGSSAGIARRTPGVITKS